MAFPRRLLVEGEELVLDLRPHWIALVGPAIVAVLVAIAWVVGAAKLDGAAAWAVFAVGLVVLAWYSVPKAIVWATSHFVVTSDRVLHRRGLVAKHSMEIPLEHINDVRFAQNVFERMIGAGTLIIQSASEQGREEFQDVRHPEEVQKTIYRVGEKNKERMYRGGPSGPPASPSVTTELERLADLRAKGILTEEEFREQKARILGSG
ncbi:MAG: PH domain-containing protein [Actinobacteria bacterium]|nr:PH domain-containing protein [Actinomycetota bacterium]